MFDRLKTYFLPVVVIAVCAFLSGCRKDKVTSFSGVIWGTSYHVTLVGQAEDDEVAETVNAVLDSLDGSLNAFNPKSEISVFNSVGTIAPSGDFSNVLQESFVLNRMTDGAFDPTVGPLVDFWGFGAVKAGQTVDSEEFERARQAVGLDKIVVVGDSVRKILADSRLDFGAIAKGYAVDRVFNALSLHFAPTGVMVEIGGEVRAAGTNGDGEPWKIQIDAPVRDASGRHTRLGIVELTDGAMATSGNYRNFRTLSDGRIVAHTISPSTGQPVESDVLSATIIASETMRADALATAAMVMGCKRMTEILNRLVGDDDSGVYGAILVTDDGIVTVGLQSRHARFHAVGQGN